MYGVRHHRRWVVLSREGQSFLDEPDVDAFAGEGCDGLAQVVEIAGEAEGAELLLIQGSDTPCSLTSQQLTLSPGPLCLCPAAAF